MKLVRFEDWGGTQFNLRIMEGLPRDYPFPRTMKHEYFVCRHIDGAEHRTLYLMEAWIILRGHPTRSFNLSIGKRSVIVRNNVPIDCFSLFHMWTAFGAIDRDKRWFAVKAK